MSTANLSENHGAGVEGHGGDGHEETAPAKTKKSFTKWWLLAALVLLVAAVGGWYWWSGDSAPTPAPPPPVVAKVPVTVSAPTIPKVAAPAPVPAPTVVAAPTPTPAPLPAATTPDSAEITDVEKVVDGKRNNCAVLKINGVVARETCIPIE